jgi:predicted dinucleotide-binding enzyme
MRIGIIGSGDVAQSLGNGLVEAGHRVMLGTRDTSKRELAAWRKKSDKSRSLGSTTEAASFGDIAILAVAWHAAEDVLAQVRPQLSGKVVIDVTNPLVYHEDSAPTLSVGHTISAGEIVQQCLPDSHVVKTLNIINHTHIVRPKYQEGIPIMFVCGNNDSAKKQAHEILIDLGWVDSLDIGSIEKARVLEPMCLLWVEYGVVRNTWDHAFAVLTK